MLYAQAKTSSCRHPQQGYALVIMLILLVAGSLYTLVDRLSLTGMKTAQTLSTSIALKQAKEALLAYASTYRDRNPDYGFGYLPCPDMAPDDAPPMNMLGTGAGSCSQGTIGLLPYRTLGLQELRDSEGNCLWYAISGSHIPNSLNKTSLQATTAARLEVIDTAGTKLIHINPPGELGAAAIVFAAGGPIGQQSRGGINKPCGADSTQASEYLESLVTPFTHGDKKNVAGAIVGNDHLIWLSTKEIFDLASKRTDYNNNAPITPPQL